jgi:hypothetical protein
MPRLRRGIPPSGGARLAASKAENFSTHFLRAPFFDFSFKEEKFSALPFRLTRNAPSLPPQAALRAAEQAGKNSFSPDPFFFLPACLGFTMKFFGGRTIK